MQSNPHGDDDGEQPRDEERGQFGSKYPDEAFLDAIEDAGHAATQGVADRVGCDHSTATRRLNDLADSGEVERTDLGNNIMWTLSES